MSLSFVIPGSATLDLTDLVLDVNGTLTSRGELIDGVQSRLQELRSRCTIHLVSADTFGTLDDLAHMLGVSATKVATGHDKLDFVMRRGPATCGVIGNGRNDCQALRAAALGIVILGPEGASPPALQAADLLCASATDALDLLLEPRAIAASLRP